MKILVLRLGGFAEVLLTTPVIRCLRRTAPAARLHLITNQAFFPLLHNNPFLYQCRAVEEGEGLFASLKEEAFDWVVDLQNDAFSNRLAKQLGFNCVRVQRRGRSLLARMGFGQDAEESRQFVRDCFDAVAPLGVSDDGGGLDFLISATERVAVHDIPHSHHAGFLCIAIEPTSDEAKLPLPTLQALCREINHPVILLGRIEDAVSGESIAAVDPIKIYNACGKFNFAETADLIQQSKLLIAGPSPWVQIGAALRKEAVVLQTGRPSLDTTPYYGQNFLQQKPGAFDAVQTRSSFWQPKKALFDVNEILEKVQCRLRKKS